jgi:hypothetical protein
MAYFIFLKNLDNIEGTLSRIAETENDLNNLNIIKDDYKIIEESQENFNSVKFSKKSANKYNGNTIIFENLQIYYINKDSLISDIEIYKKNIKNFIDLNPDNKSVNKWINYLDQLTKFDYTTISFPLNTALEEYFNDLNLTSLSPLQLP